MSQQDGANHVLSIDQFTELPFDSADAGTGQPNCSCGMCMIRISSQTIGNISLKAFMRFLVSTLWEAEKHSRRCQHLSLLNPGFTWINCTGHVRSQTWDVVGPSVSQSVRRVSNLSSVVKLCSRYTQTRKDFALTTATAYCDISTANWKVIQLSSVKAALMAIEKDEDISVASVIGKLIPQLLADC